MAAEQEMWAREEGEARPRRRRGERRHQRRRYVAERIGFLLWTLFLLAAGTLLVLNPFATMSVATSPMPDTMTLAQRITTVGQTWLAHQKGAEFLGILVLVGATVGAWIEARRWFLAGSALWQHICPNCENTNIKRIHRRFIDRVANWAGVPIRRYMCPKCGWVGPRLGT
jgi:hypothetical protein